ncbi:Rv2175c family DNA-binding protein [Humidisolicoccus flavus]|uniref:Rv2175c family DNA-binding protein n=1 Tax=Humidisolicoccus flavus TaxID=3111414 RepID=UPI003254E509
MEETTAGTASASSESQWLTIPDLVEILGVPQTRVRRLIEERSLLASRRNGPLQVPSLFVRDGAVISEVKGTVIVLLDKGFTEDEAIDWMLAPEDSLRTSPIEALRQNRKAETRRIAQALA